jgi:hypothetical protein
MSYKESIISGLKTDSPHNEAQDDGLKREKRIETRAILSGSLKCKASLEIVNQSPNLKSERLLCVRSYAQVPEYSLKVGTRAWYWLCAPKKQ